MTNQLEGKIAVVTGGSQGIGRAIAECMVNSGAKVIIGDKNPVESTNLYWHSLDVANENSIKEFVKQTTHHHGPVNILVNNAGIMTNSPLIEQSVKEWDQVMAVNLRGPFLMAKHFVPLMEASQSPAIINIGSIEGISGNPNHSAYMASKAGVHGLTASMAIDLGPKGIRVNAIAPGWINTELNQGYLDGLPDQEAAQKELATLHPIGHIGKPSDIGDTAVWLASTQSRFVTGQVIKVEGGRMSQLSLPSIFKKSH